MLFCHFNALHIFYIIFRVEARELVLNHIIERKRLDDLVKSIVEGRMKDQKVKMDGKCLH